jgi:hypothetical protein
LIFLFIAAFNPFGWTQKDAKKQSAAQARLQRHLKAQEDIMRIEVTHDVVR